MSAAKKNTVHQPLWPLGFAANPNNLEGISPITSIWVIGTSGRGKSTFATSIPAANPLVFDAENSYTTLRFLTRMTRVDIREKARALPGTNILHNLFVAFKTELDALQPGTHDLLVIDPFSDLYFGSYFWVLEHPELFGKNAQNYRGEMGTKSAYGDVTLLWKDLIKRMESKVQTVVLTSHPKDVIDKSTGIRTGQQTFRGADITDSVTLKLWLFDERDEDPEGNKPNSPKFAGRRWALVLKSRLSWHYYPNEGETRFPRILDILPRKLVVEQNGQSFAELIYGYLQQPQPDYGALDTVTGNPTQTAESEQSATLQRLAAAEAELRVSLERAKNEMVARLVQEKLYANRNEVAAKVIELELAEDAQHVEKMLSVERALRKAATNG